MRPSFKREDCSTCRTRTESFFCDLDPSALREFHRLGYTNSYPAASVLFTAGQSPQGVFLVCSGAVKMSICTGDGRTLISRIVSSGEVAGLSNVITGSPYQTTAETTEASRLHFVRRDDFLRFLPAVSLNTVRQLSLETESTIDNMRALGLSHSAAEKLANLLLAWCDRSGRPCPEGIRVPFLMTHADISQMIGTSRETVTRLLTDFRDDGTIVIRGAALIVRDRDALEKMVLL